MRILILGDVGASHSNVNAFCQPKNDLFSAEIQKMCKESDLVVLNLEKPLTDIVTPLGKCPPDYFAPLKSINGIKLLNPTVVTLANNHIMDQQDQGFISTINILKQNKILYVGAGVNEKEARKPLIIGRQNKRIGIYGCCEKEFSFSSETSMGANVYDPLETFDDIGRLTTQCEYLIVLFHGGMQGYPYPTPRQQKVCRKMCEEGADLVICQHSHIVGCEENYIGKKIVYGQGNFLLDDICSESWSTGLITSIDYNNGEEKVEYIPVKTKDHKVIIHPDSDRILQEFQIRSKRIAESGFIENNFSTLSKEKISDYLIKLAGVNKHIQRIVNKLGVNHLFTKKYSKEAVYRILDYYYCDSHREIIEKGLEAMLNNEK